MSSERDHHRHDSERDRARDREHDRDWRRSSRSPPRSRPQQQRRRGNDDDGLSEAMRALPESERFGLRTANPEPPQNLMGAPDGAGGGSAGSDTGMASKIKPNYGLSGKLAAETNTINGVVLKYSEPPEAKKPMKRWRLHVFKGSEQLEPLRIHRQSAYLLGRERSVVDVPMDHPSCSKQHAAIQFRQVEMTKPDGKQVLTVKPYIIDLDSANGTFLNNERIEPSRYIELKEKDVLRFGMSTRDYVLLIEPLGAASGP